MSQMTAGEMAAILETNGVKIEYAEPEGARATLYARIYGHGGRFSLLQIVTDLKINQDGNSGFEIIPLETRPVLLTFPSAKQQTQKYLRGFLGGECVRIIGVTVTFIMTLPALLAEPDG
jgi:hypothetical protein